ncbi:MAG: flagellar biosynthetic protein FliO [Fimbriimonadaceae bacterium]|nr:flagellar biosynthetic protein FliO [Alphaproteobacteria bacterium]
MNELLNFTENNTVRAILVLAAVILLIIVLGYFMRGVSRRGAGHKRGRVARLSIVEAIAIDQRRRLVLVRRDNAEHLLMIGGSSDVLIEEKIQRIARPVAAQRQVAERIDPRTVAQPAQAPDAAARETVMQPGIPSGAMTPATPVPGPRPVPATPPAQNATPKPAPPAARSAAPLAAAIPVAAASPSPAAPTPPVAPTPPAAPVPASSSPIAGSTANMMPSRPPVSTPPVEPPKTAPAFASTAPPSPVVAPIRNETAAPASKPVAPVAATPTTEPEPALEKIPAPEMSAKQQQIAEMERQLENALRGSVSADIETGADENGGDQGSGETDAFSGKAGAVTTGQPPENAADDDPDNRTAQTRSDTEHENPSEKTGS